jgi:hypothetical protein
MSRQGVEEGPDKSQLTFWRKYTDKENGVTYARQVAGSGNFPSDCFIGSYDSKISGYSHIISGAIEKQVFVLWRNDLKKGDPVSWSNDGDAMGNREIDVNGIGFIEFSDHNKCFFTPLKNKLDNRRKGLICLGVSSPEGTVHSGICLDTPLQPDFLQTEWTKNYLYRVASIMQLLPDDLLITAEMRKQCRDWN